MDDVIFIDVEMGYQIIKDATDMSNVEEFMAASTDKSQHEWRGCQMQS